MKTYSTRGKDGRPVWHTPDDVTRTAEGATLADGTPVEIGPVIKMSKSKKNVVDPMDIIARYGADTARWFVMSDSPPERDVEWTAAGAEGRAKAPDAGLDPLRPDRVAARRQAGHWG